MGGKIKNNSKSNAFSLSASASQNFLDTWVQAGILLDYVLEEKYDSLKNRGVLYEQRI